MRKLYLMNFQSCGEMTITSVIPNTLIYINKEYFRLTTKQ